MPDSILVAARNSLSGRTARTTRSGVTALIKSLPRPAPGPKAVYLAPNPYVRKLSISEEVLVMKIYDYLSPTILHPLQEYQRPWPRTQAGSTGSGGLGPEYLQLQLQYVDRFVVRSHRQERTLRHLERSLTSFVTGILALASFEKVDSNLRRGGDLTTTLDTRRLGQTI